MSRAFLVVALALAVSLPCKAANIATLSFDRRHLTVDPNRAAASYTSYRSIPVGFSALLPVRTIYLDLSANDQVSELRFDVYHQDTLSETLPPERLIDITTSDDARLDERIRADRQSIRPGFTPVQVVREGSVGGRRYAELAIFPLTVTPDGTLLFNRDISISTAVRQIYSSDVRETDPAATETAAQDDDAANSPRSPGTIDYVIVTSASLASAFVPLQQYKRETGYTVEIIVIDSILQMSSGRDNAEKLRTYLKGFHQQGGRYLLLGGDESILPIRYAYDLDTRTPQLLDQQQVCDLYFADLTGDWDRDGDSIWGEPTHDTPDLTPELFVGRLPLRDHDDVAHYIQKLIEYETCSGTNDLSYLGKSLIFSSDQMRDYGYGGQHEAVTAAFPSSFTIDTANGVESLSGEDPAPANLQPAELRPVLATGFGMINVIAHGRPDGFIVRSARYNEWPKSYFLNAEPSGSQGSIDSIFALGKPAFYYSLACDNGLFDASAFPQNDRDHFMCPKLLGDRRGAVAFIGNTRWGWVSVSYRMQAAFYDSLFAHPDRPAVEAMYASKKVYRYYRDLVYGQDFLGDPTLRLYTRVPDSVSIQVTSHADSLGLQVMSGDDPLAEASVYLSEGGTVVGRYRTDQNGHAVITYPFALATSYRLAAVAPGSPVARAAYTRTLVTDVGDDNQSLPEVFSLSQNYPNPFNPNTTISFDLPERSDALLTVHNLLGQAIITLSHGMLSSGKHEIEWDGRDSDGESVASGVYFYRLQAGQYTQSRKMVLLK